MVVLSEETIAEIWRLYKENNSNYKIAKKLDLQIYTVCKVVDPERWLRVYNKNSINSRVKPKSDYVKPLKTAEKVLAKKANKIKQEAINWIRQYYVESDENNYPLSQTWKDYEYHCLNPSFHDMLSKSQYVKALLECGFCRFLKVVRTDKNTTTQNLFNLERRR